MKNVGNLEYGFPVGIWKCVIPVVCVCVCVCENWKWFVVKHNYVN